MRVACVRLQTSTMTGVVQMSIGTSFAEGKPIFGVTCLDNELYVLRRRTADVEVYDVSSYQLARRLRVRNLRNPLDLAACAQMKQLYVVDGLDPSGKVFAVAASGGGGDDDIVITSWSVGEMVMNVSVTATASVLVTCGKVGQLHEFSHDGQLLRHIALCPELASAQHAVQLAASPDNFVVCHGWMDDSMHRVCIVDAQDGASPPTHVYGHQRGSANSDSLHNPSHLGVDSSHHCVFVVDMGNRRVVALDDSTLSKLADVPVVDKKRLPSRICLDEGRSLLYVACNEWKDVFWTSGSVMVFSVSYSGGE